MIPRGYEIRFTASASAGEVSGFVIDPPAASSLLVLAHGAGAGMRHPFLETLARQLAAEGIATLRFQFPYMEKGLKRTDPAPVAQAAVGSALAKARTIAGERPLLAGGKSFGGRMTSMAAAAGLLEGVRGLVFFGFPLHAAGRPDTSRAEHLAKVPVPMLFLQGTRDSLADLNLLRPLLLPLGKRATLHVIEEGDHSFHVPKSSGRTDGQVIEELAQVTRAWTTDATA